MAKNTCKYALYAALLVLASSGAAGANDQNITTGNDLVVYNWRIDRCDPEDIPDVALRILNDGTANAALLSSNSSNRLRRIDFTTLRVVPMCTSALVARHDADPSRYNDVSWLASLASQGETVHAMIHHEYHGNDHSEKCRFKTYEQCWYNTITYARSDDGGATFHQAVPPAVIAAPPFRQESGQGRRRGFFNPSNIIFDRGFWWTFIYTSGWNGQPYGSCLFRTSDINDPESWRAYDGAEFQGNFPDPYLQASTPAPSRCVPLFQQTVGSVSKISDGRFVSTFIEQRHGADPKQSARFFVALAWSHDLIHWSSPQEIAEIADVSSQNCQISSRYAFPALVSVDNGILRQNELRGRVFLSLVRFNVHDCKISLDRDLVFRRLSGF